MNKDFSLDYAELVYGLKTFIKSQIISKNYNKAIIGVSGGVDSAVVLKLIVDTIGAENTIALLMPYGNESNEDMQDAENIIDSLGALKIKKDITELIDSYFKYEPDASKHRIGSKISRERMSILYDYSEKHHALVIGTSNKTEILLGYGTHYGDNAYAVNPIGNLYKTQVWELAKFLNVSEKIINKQPSAQFWPNMEENSSSETKYGNIDTLLYHIFEEKKTFIELLAGGYHKEIIDGVVDRIKLTEFKRKPPIVCTIENFSFICSKEPALSA